MHHLRLPSIQRLFLYRSEEKEKKTKEENVEFNDMRNEKVTEMFVHHIVYEIVNAGICMSRHVHNWHQIAKVFFSRPQFSFVVFRRVVLDGCIDFKAKNTTL